MPEIPPGHLKSQHPVHQRMRAMFGGVDFPAEQVRRARAGYYGLITYLDEKIGRLLAVLEETGQRDNTLIVHFSDPRGNERRARHVAEVEHVRGIRQSAAAKWSSPRTNPDRSAR